MPSKDFTGNNVIMQSGFTQIADASIVIPQRTEGDANKLPISPEYCCLAMPQMNDKWEFDQRVHRSGAYFHQRVQHREKPNLPI